MGESSGDAGVVEHPLVHAHGAGFVVSETDAAVVDWSTPRAGLLREAAAVSRVHHASDGRVGATGPR
ncbi:hypothetical protein [Curtobacterium sp. Leaf261]|uniref:hypothetical protein n=1 Tax=Curtobacterium sp. Leaf261 TaxID=1736311 RepID=UPI0006F52686|nr:hypothetical protein [Curtobacterium sp. Leaf261]KQO64932.1 hypothetical protein ASF23_01850 [Curtobacterium sp. Leaf261]